MDWRPFLFGGVASIIAECGTFPIDTTKTRLQIQGQRLITNTQQLFKGGQYRGMLHAIMVISREEGPASLYRGLSAAVLRQGTYGTIKIGIYQWMKRMIVDNPMDETLAMNILCGVVAGVISSVIANPTDVLKIRMQARNESCANLNIFAALYDVFKREGIAGLWRGVIPTANRAAIVCGVELPVYDISKKNILVRGWMADGMMCHFLSSFTAGLAGALVSNPIDVVRTRLMNQRALHHNQPQHLAAVTTPLYSPTSAGLPGGCAATTQYTGAIDCLVQTVRNEGITALWKGFIPNWFRLGPWNIIFFMTYEQLRRL